MQKTLQKCVETDMGDYTYYCEVKHRIPEYPQGVYRVVAGKLDWFPSVYRLVDVSDRVWRQGPRGGVKVIKSRDWQLYITSYITNNEKYMQEFSWIKLQAKELA
jgi:hypothetical protein